MSPDRFTQNGRAGGELVEDLARAWRRGLEQALDRGEELTTDLLAATLKAATVLLVYREDPPVYQLAAWLVDHDWKYRQRFTDFIDSQTGDLPK